MSDTIHPTQATKGQYANADTAGIHKLAITPLGMTLGTFLAITFAICVAFDLLFPSHAMYPAWIKLFPGVTWISWPSFALGLVESFAYGWYVALIFVPLYNYFRGKI